MSPNLGWGAGWGTTPWGGVASVESRIVQKLIAALKDASGVTDYTGSGSSARIYGGYPQTLTDWKLPALTLTMIESPGREVNPAHLDIVNFALEVWMNGVGQHAHVWDDVMQLFEAAVDALHHVALFDKTIGIRILNVRLTSDGPQRVAPDGILHYPSRFQAMATIEGAA